MPVFRNSFLANLKRRKHSTSTTSVESIDSISSLSESDLNQGIVVLPLVNKKLLSSSRNLFTRSNCDSWINHRRCQMTIKSITRFIKKMIILLVKLKLILMVISLSLFLLYLVGMGLYNSRSIRDPCIVALDSKARIKSSSKFDRNMKNEPSSFIPSFVTTSLIGGSMNRNDKTKQESFDLTIPKIIHQQWKTEIIPDKFMKWRNKWFQLFPEPEYTHMLWTDVNGRELIEKYYNWFLPTYDGYKHNINRADAARYFILHHYGGIYADLDYEPTTNFYEYLPQNQVAMVESPYYWNEKTQNCLMSSPKNDPFWIDLFATLMKNANKEEVLEATGPILLDQAMEYSSHPSYILPCENFQRVPLGEYDQTLWTTIYDREIMFRLKPISKHCGFYRRKQCHFGRHHNTVSYRTTSGKVL